MRYKSTKTYGHERGLSCAFRQWRAKSHCNQIHGYALSFHYVFGSEKLNEMGWVMDFGGLGDVLEELRESYDHTIAVAGDDPQLHQLMSLNNTGVARVRMFPGGVGCERFAVHAYWLARGVLSTYLHENPGVKILSCEVREHGANSAIYEHPGD